MAKVFRWAARRLQKAPEDWDAAYQNAGKGAGKGLKPGYCITSLSEASGKALESARQMAKVVRWAAGRLQKAPEEREAADQRTANGPARPGTKGMQTVPGSMESQARYCAKILNDTFSRTRSSCSWLGSADFILYCVLLHGIPG